MPTEDGSGGVAEVVGPEKDGASSGTVTEVIPVAVTVEISTKPDPAPPTPADIPPPLPPLEAEKLAEDARALLAATEDKPKAAHDETGSATPTPVAPIAPAPVTVVSFGIPGHDEAYQRPADAPPLEECRKGYALADEAKAKAQADEAAYQQKLIEDDNARKRARRRKELLIDLRAAGAKDEELKADHGFTNEELSGK